MQTAPDKVMVLCVAYAERGTGRGKRCICDGVGLDSSGKYLTLCGHSVGYPWFVEYGNATCMECLEVFNAKGRGCSGSLKV